MKANLYCDSKTEKYIKEQLKSVIKKYKTIIDNNQLDELYEKLSLDDEILGISISYFTILFDKAKNVLLNLHNIPDYFLTNTDIQSFETPDGFNTIGQEAFSDCRDLITISIPKTLLEIKENAFKNCVNLKTIYYNGTQAEFAKIVISQGNDEFIKAQVQYI